MLIAMDATLSLLPAKPHWQRQARPRLAAGMLLATLLVAIVLASLRVPLPPLLRPGPEILVRLLPELIEPLAKPREEPLAEPAIEPKLESVEMEAEAAAPEQSQQPAAAGLDENVELPPDWYGKLGAAAKAAVDDMERIVAVNPGMEAKRRAAAEKFYASRAPEKTAIWDNVETDQLGRKILWSGDCYRIIDDPNPATYEIWREFQQYFIYCRFGDSEPKMLPWVDDIQARYLYLQYPDGEIPEDELRKYIER